MQVTNYMALFLLMIGRFALRVHERYQCIRNQQKPRVYCWLHCRFVELLFRLFNCNKYEFGRRLQNNRIFNFLNVNQVNKFDIRNSKLGTYGNNYRVIALYAFFFFFAIKFLFIKKYGPSLMAEAQEQRPTILNGQPTKTSKTVSPQGYTGPRT